MKFVKVTIKLDANGEYRVPSPDGTEAGAYYTDDREDAIGTAKMLYKGAGFEQVSTKVRYVPSHS